MKYPTVNLTLRKSYHRTDGKQGIYLRFTQNRACHYLSLGIYVRANHWNASKRRVYATAPESFTTNTQLEVYIGKAQKILLKYRIDQTYLPYTTFLAHFNEAGNTGQSFLAYAEQQVRASEGRLSPGTVKAYNYQINKLRGFRSEVTFSEIDHSLLRAYETHLCTARERVNNRNTINKTLSFLRTILNLAKKDGVIPTHIFEQGAKVPPIRGDRNFLTAGELERVAQLYWSGTLQKRLQVILQYFLFACYTGLSDADVRKLRFSEIQDNLWIDTTREKTGEHLRIPLTDLARALLPLRSFDNQPVFRVQTNQSSNRKLKQIMGIAGIQKSISMHCARHTFATASLDKGISLEVVQSILGHSSPSITQIYARIRDGLKEKEMEKWGERT